MEGAWRTKGAEGVGSGAAEEGEEGVDGASSGGEAVAVAAAVAAFVVETLGSELPASLFSGGWSASATAATAASSSSSSGARVSQVAALVS